ncbi:MAG: 16S rRNA (cytidine(1402)-2'-O)-methyltransferase [Ruminococcaceae bacterium]|nr:16S rRNA (cytidine(1402)-2'-O)-methyltransferase [Oscillospiraceae bacterium]MBQ2915380.1 16S rRNA (cytidine(1402)-2'-O)-methyltransferase [Clostridia bacterium]
MSEKYISSPKDKVSLYLVATPIGNLSDISERALETLENADFIAAEDTRKTGVLLAHYSIKKPLVSYYEHNLRQRGEEIIARLEAGETCALVSDAGMPAVSDPGEQLVKQCYEHGLKVSAIPGPCAFVSAIAISGLSTKRFTFEGFLSTAKNSRRERLESVKTLEHTLIFYEAPHKLQGLLEDILQVLGDRRISLVREISKIYEQVMLTTVSEAIEYYKENEPKGEFVLVIEGAAEEKEEVSDETLEKEFFELVEGGMTRTFAAKTLARKYNLSKREIYERFKEEN